MLENDIRILEIPKWGLSMEEGTLIEWLIAVGDDFTEGQEICEIESSKILNALEAPFSGTLRKILAGPGETLPVQAPIAIAAPSEVPDAVVDEYAAGLGGGASAATTESPAVSPGGQPGMPASRVGEVSTSSAEAAVSTVDIPPFLREGPEDGDVHATPRARALAAKLKINLHKVTGTGRNGRISIQDLRQAIANAGGQLPGTPQLKRKEHEFFPLPDTRDECKEVKLAGARKVIASRLQHSKQTAPHYRLTIDCRLDSLLRLRGQLNDENPATRVSINDFMVKAAAMALMQVPECNVQFNGETLRKFSDAHVAVAVALKRGLITPIVRSANRKGIVEISNEIAALVARAQADALKAEEFQGGTFTVSNLGMFGVKQFDAVINPPQAAILAVGAAEKRLIAVDEKPGLAILATVTLVSDHRVIDGAVGARFLKVFREFVENPSKMLS